MTENLLQKLEEKMMTLLSEVEDLRKEILRLRHENTTLKIEKDTHTGKLQDLVSLLDSINPVEQQPISTANFASIKPVLVQDLQERVL